jgi:hypothetical protein
MIGAIITPGYASGVTVTGNTIYVADGDSGLQIIDASDLSNPKIADTVKLNSDVRGIKISGNIAYLANGYAGLQIMNIHNPSQLLGVADTPDYAYDVAVNGNTVYIADDDSGLQMINVSDANNPFISNFLDLPDDVYGIAISEDIAYVANGGNGIQVLDIRMPTKPYKVATIQTDHSAIGLSVVDDKLYIVGYKYLSILPLAKNVEITESTETILNLKLPASSSVQKYNLVIANPQNSDNQTITFTPPFIIEKIPNQTIYPSIEEATFPLSIRPTLSGTENRNYTATGFSGDQYMLPDDHITIVGEGKNQTIHIKPPHHQYGTIPIHIIVNDGYATLQESFNLTIKYPQLNYSYSGPNSLTITQITSIERDGFTYEVNTTDNCIIKKQNNEEILRWGQEGSGNGSFKQPAGIAIDEDGFIYVADKGNNRIQVFTSYGEFITSFGEYGQAKLTAPEYINIDRYDIYISEAGKDNCKIFQQADYTEGNTKAIIVVGSMEEKDSLNEAFKNCAELAYNALIYQGLTEDNICYLSFDTSNPNVDATATIESIGIAITQWAAGQETAFSEEAITADSLVIYFVDHGAKDIFYFNKGEVLSASVLNDWLKKVQGSIKGKLIFVYEACHSGSFIPVISQPNMNRQRIIITSSTADEDSLIGNDGATSFSNYFWTDIFNGNDIETAFKTTLELKKYKYGDSTVISNSPQIDTNNNAINNENYDLNSLQNVFIGNGIQNNVIPVVKDVSPRQFITANESILLTASVLTSNDEISKVWAQIILEDNSQITLAEDEKDLTLVYSESENIYKATFSLKDQYSKETILFAIYARDKKKVVSKPKLTLLTVNDTKKPCAVIVIGNISNDLIKEEETIGSQIKNMAIRSLKTKLYSDDDIFIVDKDDEYSPDKYGFKQALSDCKKNAKDILLYMVGSAGDNEHFYFNSSDSLTQEELKSMLEDEAINNTPVTIIYDAPYANSYLPSITQDNWILLASTKSEKAYFDLNGKLSFSWHFWDKVSSGLKLWNIYKSASLSLDTIFKANQTPVIRPEGRASSYVIGYNFSRASDDPQITSVTPRQTLFCNTSAKIFAQNVNSKNDIDQVVALIYPPELPHSSSEPEIINMTNIKGTDDYVITYNDFSFAGEYYISICAFDTLGHMSNPLTTTVIQKVGVNSVISVLEVLTGITDHHPITPVWDLYDDNSLELYDNKRIGLEEAINFMQCREKTLQVHP